MTLFIILHIAICVFLVFVILLQPGKADGGVTFGGSSSQTIFGSKGAGNFLTKLTSVCAVMFLVTSFVLTRARIKEYSQSVIGKEPVSAVPIAPAGTSPAGEPAKDAGTKTEPTAPATK